jgi:RimJ/RimL family protein N-acetyltransferase
LKLKVVLQTSTVLLRPWHTEDACWYVEARDEEVYQWTTESRTLTIRETEEAIEQMNTSDRVFSWAVVDVERKQLVGNTALVLEEGNRDSGEVMYWLAPGGRGRGIASQAVQLVCQWAFADLSLKRVAERVGFQRMAAPQEICMQPERLWFVLLRQ